MVFLGLQVRLVSYSKLTADLLSKLLVASVLCILFYLTYTLKMPEGDLCQKEKLSSFYSSGITMEAQAIIIFLH